jgi:hypothetical protein
LASGKITAQRVLRWRLLIAVGVVISLISLVVAFWAWPWLGGIAAAVTIFLPLGFSSQLDDEDGVKIVFKAEDPQNRHALRYPGED